MGPRAKVTRWVSLLSYTQPVQHAPDRIRRQRQKATHTRQQEHGSDARGEPARTEGGRRRGDDARHSMRSAKRWGKQSRRRGVDGARWVT